MSHPITAAPGAAQRPQIAKADGSPVRVLVVDDENSLTDLLKMALRYEGWEVRTASDGFGAVKARRAPLPMCPTEVSSCYEHRLDDVGCRNPEFFEMAQERPSFRVVAVLTD